jgi:ABC-type nitrate/sulfonate/bicarbonate transport system substrate-binding protein
MLALQRRSLLGLIGASAFGPGFAATAQQPVQVRVINFPGVQDLPFIVAETKGFFAKRDLDVKITNTGSSTELRDGLASGQYHFAHTAADNAVAMVELQNADVAIVIGGDNSFNDFFVTPDIHAYQELRGKTVVVDAPNTAFALADYQILQQHGVPRGSYKISLAGGTPAKRLDALTKTKLAQAGMLNLPYSIFAKKAGLRKLGSLTGELGPYQGTTGFLLRPWGQANRDTVVHYIQGYIDAVRWIQDPKNKNEAIALLADRLKLTPDIAVDCYNIVANPTTGFTKDAAVDYVGFKNVLKLRAEVMGQWGGHPPPPDNYLDLSYYRLATA